MSSFFKNVLKWGLIVGVIVIIYGTLLELANIETAWLANMLGYISIVILPTGIFLGMWHLVKQNRFSLVNAVSAGLFISIIAAIIIIGYRLGRDAIAGEVGNIESVEAYERWKMEKNGAEEVKIQARLEELRQEYTPYTTYFNTLKWYLLLGSGYTLISYLILIIKVKRNEKSIT